MGQRLTELLDSRALREQMGQAARQKMEREYDISERVAVLEDLYDEVIAQYRADKR